MRKKLFRSAIFVILLSAVIVNAPVAQNQDGALLSAAKAGDTAKVQAALDNGASPNTATKEGVTPLMEAASGGHIDAVRLLLTRGADVNTVDKQGRSSITLAAEKGHAEVILALTEFLSVGPPPQPVPFEEPSAGLMVDTELVTAVSEGDREKVQELLSAGASVEARDDSVSGTCLIWACMRGHQPIIELLLESGADVNAKDKDGRTPLMWAANQGDPDAVDKLLKRGVDVNAADNDGITAILAASIQGHGPIVELLKKAGATESWGEGVVQSVERRAKCLKVANGPSNSHEQVGCLKVGEKVEFTGIWAKNNWARIAQPVEGWVDTSKLKVEGPAPKKEVIQPTEPMRPAKSEPAPKPRATEQSAPEATEAATEQPEMRARPGQATR
jgi:ankyrin repeat protein